MLPALLRLPPTGCATRARRGGVDPVAAVAPV